MSTETFSSQPRRMASRIAQGCWLFPSHCNSYEMCFFKKTFQDGNFPIYGLFSVFCKLLPDFFKGYLFKTSNISKAVFPLSLKADQRQTSLENLDPSPHVMCSSWDVPRPLPSPFSPDSAFFTHPVKFYPANGLFER